MQAWLIVLIIVLGLFAIFALGEIAAGIYTHKACFKRRAPINPKDIIEDGMFGPFKKVICDYFEQYESIPDREELSIIGERGLRLKGVLTKAPKNKNKEYPNVMIFCHGWHSKGTYDTSFTCMWPFENFDVLAIDHMGHGDSEGSYISFGILDCVNVGHWVDKINKIYNHKCNIVLYGFSMGGNTVGLCADKDMENVKCIIDDCGFTGAYDQLVYISKSKFLIFLAGIATKVAYKLDLCEKNTVKSVSNAKYPMLFIHGADDRFVPTEMSVRNYEACTSKKELLLVPGAAHATSCLVDHDKYIMTVNKFLSDVGFNLQ